MTHPNHDAKALTAVTLQDGMFVLVPHGVSVIAEDVTRVGVYEESICTSTHFCK